MPENIFWFWLIGAYLLGAVPFGLLIGLAKGVDIRKQGSGNIGASNLGRLIGKKWGVFAFLLASIAIWFLMSSA